MPSSRKRNRKATTGFNFVEELKNVALAGFFMAFEGHEEEGDGGGGDT